MGILASKNQEDAISLKEGFDNARCRRLNIVDQTGWIIKDVGQRYRLNVEVMVTRCRKVYCGFIIALFAFGAVTDG